MKRVFSFGVLCVMSAVFLSGCDDDKKGEVVGLSEQDSPMPGNAGRERTVDAPKPVERDDELDRAIRDATDSTAEHEYAVAKLYAERLKAGKANIVIEPAEPFLRPARSYIVARSV